MEDMVYENPPIFPFPQPQSAILITYQTYIVNYMMTQDERRLTIPEDVMAALNKYAAAEKDRMDNPLIKELITGKSLAQKILANEVQKRGYYEPLPRHQPDVAAERGE